MRQAIDQLRTAGVRIALDDFGSRFTALELLVDLPLDAIKLERALLGHDPKRLAVLHSAVRKTHELGADDAQGFLLGRPAPLR